MKLKKLIAVLLTGAMVVGMAVGCGKSPEKTTSSDTAKKEGVLRTI